MNQKNQVQVWRQVKDQVWRQVHGQVLSQVSGQVRGQVWRQARGQIRVKSIKSNVILGGSLHKDLNSEKIQHTTNKLEIAGEPRPLMESSFHEVVYGEETFRVNSRHHQGIDILAPSLKPLATCSVDGLLEMVEGDKSLFVQWHPERSDVWGTRAESVVYDWIKSLNPQGTHVEEINKYMKVKKFNTISYKRVRENIDQGLSDLDIDTIISNNSGMFKRVTDRKGRKAIKRK